MKLAINILLPAVLLVFISAWGVPSMNARAANSPLGDNVSPISDGGFPGDFLEPREEGCIETCQLQEDYYDDQDYGEEGYEEQIEEPYEEEPIYDDQAEEQYDDDYGDPEYGDEVYPEEEPYQEEGYEEPFEDPQY
ncbi:MAG: hypothetical protein RIG61_00195 [Deltaproteobacteria bacterium]